MLIESIMKDTEVQLYPVTIAKYLLNLNRIANFMKSTDSTKYDIDPINCQCKPDSMCRKHTSIQRIKEETGKVAWDVDSKLYFVKNEIWSFNDKKRRLMIAYCPHTKLIRGNLNASKVKKINFVSAPVEEQYDYLRNKYSLEGDNIVKFSTKKLYNIELSFWFNDEFSMSLTYKTENEVDMCLKLNN